MKFKVFGALALAVLIAIPAIAQDDAAGKKKKKGKRNQQNAASQVLKQLEKLGLSDDQVAKIKELGKEVSAKMKEMRTDAGITAELTKKRAEVVKAMKESEKKGAELAAAINKEAGFTEAQVAALKLINEVRQKFNKEVVGLLTDEQKENLPARLKRAAGGNKGKGKKGRGDDGRQKPDPKRPEPSSTLELVPEKTKPARPEPSSPGTLELVPEESEPARPEPSSPGTLELVPEEPEPANP